MPVKRSSNNDLKMAIIAGFAGLLLGMGGAYGALDTRVRANEVHLGQTQITLEYIKDSVDRIMAALGVLPPPQPPPNPSQP